MGGGGIKKSEASLQDTAATQKSTGAALGTEGQSLIDKGQSQQAPLEGFLRSIIGGDSVRTNQALAPVIGNIAKQTNTTREHIYDSTAPGAARDVLLGENSRSQGEQVASATNNVFLQAFPELASLAQGNTNAGLGLTGAGITSTGNSAQTTGTVLQAQEQQKANSLSALTGLAGVAGNVATGGFGGVGLFGKKK